MGVDDVRSVGPDRVPHGPYRRDRGRRQFEVGEEDSRRALHRSVRPPGVVREQQVLVLRGQSGVLVDRGGDAAVEAVGDMEDAHQYAPRDSATARKVRATVFTSRDRDQLST